MRLFKLYATVVISILCKRPPRELSHLCTLVSCHAEAIARYHLKQAATLIARFPPLDILAEMDARVYDRLHRSDGNDPLCLGEIRKEEQKYAIERWRQRLQEPLNSRQRAVAAIMPCFESWLKRKEHVTFHLTQILTGHGCFSAYLNKIGREQTTQCYHCGASEDTAQHTLEQCSAWCSERRVLIASIGQDLTLPSVVAAMLADKTAWKATVKFCEAVLVQKETAERDRERADPTRRRRRRGGGPRR